MTPVPDNLLRFRLARGLAQSEVARRAFVTAANLSAIESGRRDLTVGTLLRLARALEVPPHRLLTSPRRRHRLGRFTRDAVARAAIAGRRLASPHLNELARGLAASSRPVLQAAEAPGARRASRRAWRRVRAVWDAALLKELEARTRRLAWSPAAHQ